MEMLLFNADVDESERGAMPSEHYVEESCQSFYDLRQRLLAGMDSVPAFNIVALGLVRKLRTNLRGSVLHSEVEDAFSRYFRLLDTDTQRFVSLHETLSETVEKYGGSISGTSGSTAAAPQSGPAAAALGKLRDSMREIAVVLLACGEMQRKALELKLAAQESAMAADKGLRPLVSFARVADFIEEAMMVADQLRRKHEELQHTRVNAMGDVVAAKADAKKP
mmetsp:Transcript_43972/g.104072  ORF Transcript_43972/g.104072 Transcript_43972/m.104072 type:complete len:222 (-) Transcript_43972:17-682(-)